MGKHKINRAIFLDRDGVINKAFVIDGKPYPARSLEEFEIIPGVKEACRILKEAGYLLIIATNQPDVGRGTLEKEKVESIHSLIFQQLPIDRIEVCYHPGKGLSNCDCRKPLPGMLLKASLEFDIDLSQSWMIGDRAGDVECGHSAGCKTILIGNGYEEKMTILPDFKSKDLQEAVTIIIK